MATCRLDAHLRHTRKDFFLKKKKDGRGFPGVLEYLKKNIVIPDVGLAAKLVVVHRIFSKNELREIQIRATSQS